MPAPALQFTRLTKSYGHHAVLKGLDLSVAEGEIFGLVGVNGAGKTTLIKCLLDFCEPDGGQIEIFGASHRRHQARSRLAFVPEHFSPPYYLSGKDFIRYVLNLRGLRYESQQVEAALRALDLELEALKQPVRDYSKGMTRKLGLAASFLSQSDLFVLDEPMSGLDPKARALLKQYLLELGKSGRSLFFSSHALADVEEICDRMAILHQGELRFVGSPTQCCQRFGTASLEQAFLACIPSSAI
jgi:ABC-2 type transport system ATP-binding protein